jgi:TRAP-type mannitol/chloroaromatic compound transport system substrate-binding protein
VVVAHGSKYFAENGPTAQNEIIEERENGMNLTLRAALVATAAGTLIAGPASARDELSAVTALEQNNTLTRSFLETLVKPINATGKGTVQIKYLGGQEVVPPDKAANALKRGQFDVLSGPASYWVGQLPEAYAFLAANQGPKQMRANGAWKIMQEIVEKKLGVYLLSWGNSMTSYYMYLVKEPKLKDGIPDLTGLKMRATGTYRPLFRALGATTINIKSSEVYTALERGTIDGFGFTDISAIALGVSKVIKYRVLPNFYQTNTVELINMDVWKGLTQKQRDFLTSAAIKYETDSVHWIESERLKEDKQVAKDGMKDFVLKGKAAEKYVDIAHEEIWKELEKRSPENLKRLKNLMYVAGKPSRQADIPTASARLQQ